MQDSFPLSQQASIQAKFHERWMPEPNSGCWLWLGDLVQGYGRMTVRSSPRWQIRAHRLSFEIHKGPIPVGLDVLHKCDVQCCVNPDHLRVGDDQDNARDKSIRGRHPKYSLTIEQAREVLGLKGTDTPRAIAERFGVSRTLVVSIWSGRRWPQLERKAT